MNKFLLVTDARPSNRDIRGFLQGFATTAIDLYNNALSIASIALLFDISTPSLSSNCKVKNECRLFVFLF